MTSCFHAINRQFNFSSISLQYLISASEKSGAYLGLQTEASIDKSKRL